MLQVREADLDAVRACLDAHGLGEAQVSVVGVPAAHDAIVVHDAAGERLNESRTALWRAWGEVSASMQALRDDPVCAQEAYDALLDADDPGIVPVLTFDPAEDVAAPAVARGARPRVAILVSRA